MIIHLQTTITQETLQSTTIQNVQTHDFDVATLNSSYVTKIIVITLSFYTYNIATYTNFLYFLEHFKNNNN